MVCRPDLRMQFTLWSMLSSIALDPLSELQMCCAAFSVKWGPRFLQLPLINERPIGRHPTSPDDESYLCPNDLLLGRSTSRVPRGPFVQTSNPRHRYEFIHKIVDNFWRRWTTDCFPSLIIQQKWHTTKRNLKKRDIVLIQDSNQIRGQWKLGKVSVVFPEDGIVRKVHVAYKNPKPGEPAHVYNWRGHITVERSVNRLVLLLPVDEKEQQSHWTHEIM